MTVRPVYATRSATEPCLLHERGGQGDVGGTGNSMVGRFAVFNRWAEINDQRGRYLERISPGAFLSTMANDRAGMRVLLNHGKDPSLGDKPIGKIMRMEEDPLGAAYEVALFDGLPDLVLDGLRAGQYGASMRMLVTREDVTNYPAPSTDNPEGLREHVIREARVAEWGPVTFPAYSQASAGLAA